MALSKKPLPHSEHLKGFSPECVCSCHVNVELLRKLLLHTQHRYVWSTWLPESGVTMAQGHLHEHMVL